MIGAIYKLQNMEAANLLPEQNRKLQQYPVTKKKRSGNHDSRCGLEKYFMSYDISTVF
jgi:hypothetical protein